MTNAFSGYLTLQASRFERSEKLNDRFRYKLDDGTYLSIDKATGEPRIDENGKVKGTTNDGSSEAFYRTTPGIARVICDAEALGEFSFLVDEAR